MKSNQIVVSSDVQLAPYGDRDTLDELVYRVMDFHTDVRAMKAEHGEEAAKKYAIQIAQTALMMGASPLPGLNEIHGWREVKSKQIVNNKGSKQWIDYEIIRVGPGKNYWARRGRQIAGGIHWVIEPRLMTKKEMDDHSLETAQIGVICVGCRIDDLLNRQPLVEAGILDRESVIKGSSFTGIGIATKGRKNETKNGRSLFWTAEKRALADFYMKACPFIPGEQFLPGEGLKRNDDGQIVINENRLNIEANDIQIERPRISKADADKFNRALFGGPDDNSVNDSAIIDGEFDTPVNYPDVPEEFYENEDDQLDQTRPARPDVSTLSQNQFSQDEDDIHKSNASEFWDVALKHIERYEHERAIKAAAKLLGYNAVPRDSWDRVIMYRMIRNYAQLRDAGMSQDDALQQMEDSTPLPFGA